MNSGTAEITRITIVGFDLFKRMVLMRVIQEDGHMGWPTWVHEIDLLEQDARPVEPIRCYEPKQIYRRPDLPTPWDPGD